MRLAQFSLFFSYFIVQKYKMEDEMKYLDRLKDGQHQV